MGAVIIGVAACGSNDESAPDPPFDAAAEANTSRPGRRFDAAVEEEETGPPCNHYVCTNFDDITWRRPWATLVSPSEDGEAKLTITDLNEPSSKPNSLRSFVQGQGDLAYLAMFLPWKRGNDSRTIRVEFQLYLEQLDGEALIAMFQPRDIREDIWVMSEANRSLAVIEAGNGPLLSWCRDLGTVPLRQWTHLVLMLEGRTTTTPGSVTVAVGDGAPKPCKLASLELTDSLELDVGLTGMNAEKNGTNVAQYDDVFIDVDDAP